MYDECQTSVSKGFGPAKRTDSAHPDKSKDTPRDICESQAGFPFLRLKTHPIYYDHNIQKYMEVDVKLTYKMCGNFVINLMSPFSW